MRNITVYGLSLLLCTSTFANGTNAPTPPTVEKVALNQYLGEWFELERIPNEFQDNTPSGYSECYNTIASYSLRDDAKINVQNTCTREFEGKQEDKIEVAKAIGRVVRNSNNSKLKVNFTGIALLRWLGIGDGNYWIFGLGPVVKNQYKWALVGSPKLDYGWVLSRTTTLSSAEWKEIDQLRRSLGYNPGSFVKSRRD